MAAAILNSSAKFYSRSLLKFISKSNVRPFSLSALKFSSTPPPDKFEYWNKDWKPGPYPKTDAERRAAARKYGLRPEDYEPYPDNGGGYGDYPRLPYVSEASRDANYDWDFPEWRRNYGEPLHVHWDLIVEDRWDPNRFESQLHPDWWYLRLFLVSTFVLFLPLFWLPHLQIGPPAMPKQYPYAWGEDCRRCYHYTFEPADD